MTGKKQTSKDETVQFKTIPNAPKYELSLDGIVRNASTKKALKDINGKIRLNSLNGERIIFNLQDEIDALFPATTEAKGPSIPVTEVPAESKGRRKPKRKPLLDVHQVRKIHQMLSDRVPHKEIAERIGKPSNEYLVADIRYGTRKCYNEMV